MSPVVPDSTRFAQHQFEEAGYPPPASRRDSGGLPWGLLAGGLVVVGLGLMAWSYLGRDLQRYMKIRNM
jgi:hypothetical protein